MLGLDKTGLRFHLQESGLIEIENEDSLAGYSEYGLDDPFLDYRPTPVRGPRTSVIIPAFNEELTIGSVVLGAQQFSEHVIVVDDGSTDNTAKVAELAGAQVFRMAKNSGKANALMHGLRMSKKAGYEAIVLMDGDGQHRPEDIVSVIAPVIAGEADMVIGSRFMTEGNHAPAHRQLGQIILNRATNVGSKVKVSDTQSGLRALGAKAIDNLDFASEGYNIESDMIVHFADRGLTIKEVPISVRYDVPNGHKKNTLSMGMALLANTVSVVGYKRPLLVFGIPGVLLLAIGFLTGFGTMLNMHIFGSWMFQLLTAASVVIMGGFLCVSALTLNSLSLLMKAGFKKTKA